MLRNRWYGVIALTFFLLSPNEALTQNAINSSADSPTIEDSGHPRPAHKQGSSDRFSLPIWIVKDPEESESAKRREDDSNEREKRDLAAQESMAKSTLQTVEIGWWQLYLAAIGTVVAIGGTGGLVYSLVLVSYRDTFRPEIVRRSECCFSLTYRGKQLNDTGELVDIFQIIPTGQQNGAN